MAPVSANSSPTIRSPSFPFSQNPPLLVLDLKKTALLQEMENGDSKEMPRDPESDESEFFDLQPPAPSSSNNVKTEDIMARLTSAEHLHWILADHVFFYRFSAFLNRYNAHLVPTLIRYLEMRKAIKAIEYANAVAKRIRWPSHTDYCKFSKVQAGMVDVRFEDYASRELLLLCTEALPAFITHTLVDVVSDCVSKDITGQTIPVVRDLIGNLAEVFCLTDPSIHDNPIIYASEEYGTTYAIDRNCRFLQGPATDKNCTLRIARACSLGRDSNEILLNYRRDGTPFINLLMCAPLYDDKGIVRYFIGSQTDVTMLVHEGMGIESFRTLLQQDKQEPKDGIYPDQNNPRNSVGVQTQSKEALARLQELGMMLSQEESEIVNKNSRGGDDDTDTSSIKSGASRPPTSVKNRNQTRRVIGGEEALGSGLSISQPNLGNGNASIGLPGIYKHYILVRPHPSLQIIFVSPSLRLPGLLRTHLFSKLGGPAQTMSALEDAFRDGAAVTAKVLWLPKNTGSAERGRGGSEVRPRWIRCTPLLGSDDRVGVWMIILVPVDGESTVYRGREHISYMVDEAKADRKKFDAMARERSTTSQQRRAGSIDRNYDGGFGLKKRTENFNTLPRRGRRDSDHQQLYAEYLRGSPSTGSTV
ncbi:Phototropin-2 [Lachnellula suecica]|uniref:Phototropin-2 n=1 Tax=Lachnellula suecica TaxID=602035 RepID=A0A8T9CIT3_9HELO|nr:Phototropin-2 [Lachnellula suecica]